MDENMTSATEVQKDFDLLEIPIEGVAAYWLSLKKLVAGVKRNLRAQLEGEAEYTTEPFVRHLLEVGFTDLDEPLIRRLSEAKRDLLFQELTLRLDLMRVTLKDIASSENPRLTVARLTGRFARPIISEEKAFKLAQELLAVAREKRAERAAYFNVHHRIKPEQLLVTLLFYVIWTRHESRMTLRPFLEHIRSRYFADGLALVADGFETGFVARRMILTQRTILAETRRKMDMSLELCMAIRNRVDYDDMLRIARSYMV